MRIVWLIFFLSTGVTLSKSQLSGTISIPSSSFSTLQAALVALNTQSIAAGGLTIEVAAGNIENVPAGGFVLSVSGTSTHPLVIKKNGSGNKPLFVAYVGSSTSGSSQQDGLFRFLGCDHVVLDGLAFVDPNTTNPQTMEFGFGFFKTSSTDGCQSNVIKNCELTLSIHNNASGAGPAADGSRGIEFVNATTAAHSTSLASTAISGSHSFNKIQSNKISGTNVGISLSGYLDVPPHINSDHGNEIGGTSPADGNVILNFGGGGTVNAAAAVETTGQYNLLCAHNQIRSNDGSGANHLVTLRGLKIGNAPAASSSVIHNTITLTPGGTSSQVTAIENTAGGSGLTNTVDISYNHIVQCEYAEAISGSFSGISHNATAGNVFINSNRFRENSSSAISGSNYLISCSGNFPLNLQVKNNELGFYLNGPLAFTGNLYGIFLSGATAAAAATVSGNHFQNFTYTQLASGSLYFIYNTADLNNFTVQDNLWKNLFLNTGGSQYYIYNSSSTASLLSVCGNTVSHVDRSMATGNTYVYYGNASSPATAVHTFSGNTISHLSSNVGSTGSFYGFYNTEGNVSPYPKKIIHSNRMSNVQYQTTGAAYGFYISDLGDSGSGGASAVHSNTIDVLIGSDNVYGIYLASPYSPSVPVEVYSNRISGLYSSGASSSVYGVYAGANNAGLNCFRNKLYNIHSGGLSSTGYGIYLATVNSATLHNNSVAQIGSSGSGNSRANGIYISSNGNYFLYYNTVYLAATSLAPNFGNNALYTSTTASLTLRNNILTNLSVPTGTGICVAFRRSSSNLNSYLSASDNNLLYAGTPATNRALMHNGTTGYQTLTAYKSAVTPRDISAVSAPLTWLSNSGQSPNFLHLTASVSNAAESAASAITQYSLDTDSEIRHGASGYLGAGTQPDIGADEFELNTTPCTTLSASSITSSLMICEGETFSVTANNLTPGSGLTYQWEHSGSSAGTYSNVISGSGIYDVEYTSSTMALPGSFFYRLKTTCGTNSAVSVSNVLTITVLPIPAASIVASSTVVCAQDTLNLLALGNPTATFEWSGPAGFYGQGDSVQRTQMSLLKAGTYSLSCREGICSAAVKTIQIIVSDPDLKLITTGENLCAGSSATLFALSTSKTYSWNIASNSASVVVSPSVSTGYTVEVLDSLNCYSKTSCLIAVIHPTIQGTGAVACGSPGSATLSAKAFTPASLRWFTSLSSTTAISTGTNYPLTANTNTTLYVEGNSAGTGSIAGAAAGTLTTEGIMFDLIVQNKLVINSVEVNYSAVGTTGFEIWSRLSSHQGAGTSALGWTIAASGTVNITSSNQLTALTVPGGITALKGQTLAIYVVASSTNQIAFTSGTLLGTTLSQNKDLKIKEGSIGSYFNCQSSPAAFCGRINYSIPGCLSPRLPVTLTVSSVPQLTTSTNINAVCPGKVMMLTVAGASTYSWSGVGSGSMVSVNPTTSKIYSVTGTNSVGCKNTSTLLVNTLAAPALSVSPAFTLACPLQPVSLTVSGALTYTWNTGPNGPLLQVTPVSLQTYSVQGTNSLGCVSVHTVAVGTLTTPFISILASSSEICPGETVNLEAAGALSYTWLPSGAMSTSIQVNPSSSAVYNAIGLGVNGCTNVAFAMITVDACVSVTNNMPTPEMKIYPNPSEGTFIVELQYASKMFVIDHLGRKLFEIDSSRGKAEVDLGAVPRGCYTLVIYDGRHWHYQKLLRK